MHEIHFKNHIITVPLEHITENYALYYDREWKCYFVIHISTGYSLTGKSFKHRENAVELCEQAEKHLPFPFDNISTYNQRWQQTAIENSEVKQFVDYLQQIRYEK